MRPVRRVPAGGATPTATPRQCQPCALPLSHRAAAAGASSDSCWVCEGSGLVSKWLPTGYDAAEAKQLEDDDETLCSICFSEGLHGLSTSCGKHFFCDTCLPMSLDAIRDQGQFPGVLSTTQMLYTFGTRCPTPNAAHPASHSSHLPITRPEAAASALPC